MEKIKIISRKSHLAQIQAEIVGNKIIEKFPNIEIEYIQKETQGDIDLNTPLSEMPEIGVFTNDIRNELLNLNADLAVHSWKDLPIEMEPGTKISATLDRADLRDILLFKRSSIVKKEISLLTSSPRRKENLSKFLPKALPSQPDKIEFKEVRGNILTRIKKLMDSDSDGLVMAKAALDRIIKNESQRFLTEKKEIIEVFEDLSWMILPVSENPAAPAQGALAIETRSNDNKIIDVLDKINNREVFHLVEKEREILKSYGGGCHQKIGVSYLNLKMGKSLSLRGETEQGKNLKENSFIADEKHTDKSLKNIESYYPENKKDFSLFDRKVIDESSMILKEISNSGIYVTRGNALNDVTVINESNIIWTSGIKTWFTLSKKGLWINGTSDSLGELESPPENLFEDLKWYKLTHDLALQDDKKIIPTYKLIRKELSGDLKDVSHFYWMSSSSFDYAIEKFPEIKEKSHACGLGRTFEEINKIIPGKVYPYLNYEDWLEKVKQAK